MSATVHRLFPGRSGKGPQPSASGGSAPLIDALQEATTPLLQSQLRALFEGADDAMFRMSQRATALEDHRSSFDNMRTLRQERGRIESDFVRLYTASLRALPDGPLEEFDLDRLSIQPTEELEERIAVSNLVAKAEKRNAALLRDIGARITHLIRDLGMPVSRQALTPASICNAFKTSIAGLDLPLQARLVVYKLFDRACVEHLRDVYEAAVQVFDAHQVKAPPPTAEPVLETSPYAPPPVASADEVAQIEPPALDHSTRAALREIGSTTGGYKPQDAQFAQELLGFADVENDDKPSVARVAPAQRISLVGQMCNEILSDPHLPSTMGPLFERLRFPLIKIALADGSFFGNRVHPVRRLVAEAAETAASSRVASPAVVRRLEERLRQIAEQIDLSAAFVRPQLAHLLPLTMAEIASFLDQQREESETRRENVLNKVRRTVAQELEVHTLGRKPPASLVNFLRIAWGPLMAARLLRDGMNSRPWLDAVDRLVQILGSLDVIDVTDEHLAQRRELLDAVSVDLTQIGMRDDKIGSARGHLEKTYAEIDERLARMSPLERELQSSDLALLSPMETAAMLAEFPAPGSSELRAPTPEAPHREPLLDLAPIPDPAPAPPATPAAPAAPTTAPAVATPVEARASSTPAPAPAPDVRPGPAKPPASPRRALAEPDIDDRTPETQLLALCLTAETWFRVFDASNGQTLWLKVSRYYPEHDSVGFNGFDAKKTLSIRASRLIDDLVAGRSEPVNASPVQVRAMAELRRRHRG